MARRYIDISAQASDPSPRQREQAELERLRSEVDRLTREAALFATVLEGMGVDVGRLRQGNATGAMPGNAVAAGQSGNGREAPAAAGAASPHAPLKARAQSGAADGHTSGARRADLDPMAKVRLFRGLFAGRPDVYAARWESGGRSGYSPVCNNLWRPGVCRRPKGHCAGCPGRNFQPFSDRVAYDHLSGKIVAGLYPLCTDDTCRLCCVDFAGRAWKEDALAFLATAAEEGVPALAEISRSGEGAHAWIFFEGKVPAQQVRKLATALLSVTCARRRVIDLSAYDRIFPGQDRCPKDGHLGSVIALPLQKEARAANASVFADSRTLEPLDDQWAALESARRMGAAALSRAVERLCGQASEFALAFDDTDPEEPWKRRPPTQAPIEGPRPARVEGLMAGELFLKKETLTEEVILRLRRLAAFPNPEFFKAEALRLPVWNRPRVIICARDLPRFVALPRGCVSQARELLANNGIELAVEDRRSQGTPITAFFRGELRDGQRAALKDVLPHDIGVLSAPTAFGKTVLAAALIAERRVSTLILVHRAELLRQWKERLAAFLDLGTGEVGVFGGTKKKPGRVVDVAIMQSLLRLEDAGAWMEPYGQVIVDECHHVSAFTFETLARQARARYVLGLTATPVRRDGHHPIIFMQCGPIRHRAARDRAAFSAMEVRLRHVVLPPQAERASVQDLYRAILDDHIRNAILVDDIRAAFAEGRKVLVLTERLEHLEILRAGLQALGLAPWVLHGRQGARERAAVMDALQALDDCEPRVILATGRLVGEGFDHPPLDTLVLAMPISWRGNLQQYAGRLHRRSAEKHDVRVHDYVEDGVATLGRMWERRKAGYAAMGYEILDLEPRVPSDDALDALRRVPVEGAGGDKGEWGRPPAGTENTPDGGNAS